MGAAPAPALGSATWTLVGVLEAAWEATGTTFIGRERPALFQVAGTRRMAARHGGHSAGRWRAAAPRAVWRHWFEQTEQARLDRLRTWPVARRVAITLGDPILAYRIARAAVRTGRATPDLEALPETLRGASLLARERLGGRPPAAHQGQTGRPNSERTWRGPWS